MNYEFPEIEKQAATDAADWDAEVDEVSPAARRSAELAQLQARVQAARHCGA